MKKGKATFCTSVIWLLIGAVDACLFTIKPEAFYILTGVFAAYGFISAGADFQRWLQRGEAQRSLTPIIVGEPIDGADKLPPATLAEIDSIVSGIQAENRK